MNWIRTTAEGEQSECQKRRLDHPQIDMPKVKIA
jgi:hypothetical protein